MSAKHGKTPRLWVGNEGEITANKWAAEHDDGTKGFATEVEQFGFEPTTIGNEGTSQSQWRRRAGCRGFAARLKVPIAR